MPRRKFHRLDKVGREVYCGWPHSPGWNPGLCKWKRGQRCQRHSPLILRVTVKWQLLQPPALTSLLDILCPEINPLPTMLLFKGYFIVITRKDTSILALTSWQSILPWSLGAETQVRAAMPSSPCLSFLSFAHSIVISEINPCCCTFNCWAAIFI